MTEIDYVKIFKALSDEMRLKILPNASVKPLNLFMGI